jgi:ferrochelatase
MKGVLLINLGTPDSPSVPDVRAYLKEFLSDPYVIDINPVVRYLLLKFIILPKRPKESAALYQNIWTEHGSPLLVNTELLAQHAQTLLGQHYKVSLGMRYGKPSIELAVDELVGCEEIIVLPLFPQYSLAATETAIQKALHHTKNYWNSAQVTIIKDFYKADQFISAQAKLIAETLANTPNPEKTKVIFSYHGLPERQILKTSGCNRVCNMQKNCPVISDNNRDCYRAQCYATTRALAKKLTLTEQDYTVAFQSRLGRIPWIKPYTDEVLTELAAEGIEDLVVTCPSFVCDCLETLEEIGLRAREQWQADGGKNLWLVPCVNDDATWVADLIEQYS